MSDSKNLTIDTPEVDNWVIRNLTESGIKISSLEGYSVKDGNITALFERRVSSTDVEEWSDNEIGHWLETKTGINWLLKVKLSSILDIPLYLAIWKNDSEKFRILKLDEKESKINGTTVNLFENCEHFASWLAELKGITVSKGFVEHGRLALIDICLRRHGVPWPGNLDGFILNEDGSRIKSIFEFSRTRKYPVKSHDLNNFFSQDLNRWSVFNTLRKILNCSAFIVIWSSEEKIIKLQKLKDIDTNGLIIEEEVILTPDEIVTKINSFE